MRIFYPAAALLLLAACEQHGGAMPVEGKDLLSTLAGPKIPTMQETQLEAAKNAERNGDYAGAAQIYESILEKDPNNENIIELLGYALRRNGEHERSIRVYDGLIAKDANNIAAKEGKALALLSKGDFETPTNLFQEVIKADPKRWKSLNGLGILFVTRSLYPEAMIYFEEALKHAPSNVSVLNNLGLSQALNKQYSQAVDSLTKASATSMIGSTDRKRVDLNLALVYASAGNIDEARKIAEIYLNGPALKNNLGLYAHLANDDALAKSYLNMALTESKVHYGKAWENLENLNNKSNKTKNSAQPAAAENKKDEPKTKKEVKPSKETSEEEKTQKKVTITNDSAPLGDIISNEIKNPKKVGIAVSAPVTQVGTQALDAPAPAPAPAVGNPINSLEKSLGTIKADPAKKDDSNATVPAAQ